MVRSVSVSRFSILSILLAHRYSFSNLTNLSRFLIFVILLKLKSRILCNEIKFFFQPISVRQELEAHANRFG